MELKPHVFREYDIRGIVDQELSDDFAFLLGRAFGELARENGKNNIAVGHDTRLSSLSYAKALAGGIAAEGLEVQLTGKGPTPQLYFALFHRSLGGGIQVTGSHNPPNMNGFKICLGTQTLSGEQIQDLYARMLRLNDRPVRSVAPGRISDAPIQQVYTQALISNCKPHMGKRKLKVVVDAGNGVGGMVGPAALNALGVEVSELYCEPDGRFPNHHPDPTVMANIQELIATVRKTGADFGIGWDGDADRIGVVDERGEVIFGDLLLLLYGREILKQSPGATIIGDVKCSSRLFDDLRARGANVIMWKTGHSLIKSKLKETGGELGGEMSGHIFFKHRFFGFDDAIYATLRLAEIMSHSDTRLSEMLSDLPQMTATPEIRVDCPEEIKFRVVELAQKAFPEYRVETVDGARISFEHGWGLLRASNTQPVLVLRFEATSPKYLEDYRSLVESRLDAIRQKLAH